MRIPVRSLAAAAIALPLLATAAPAGAASTTGFDEVQPTFTSTETGDEVSWFSASTSVDDPTWPYTITESSGDFAECYAGVRVETHATWVDGRGRTVRVTESQRSFIDVIRFEDVARDLVVHHEVTYGQCDRRDQCHYELETSAK